jgi:hypothetical protein
VPWLTFSFFSKIIGLLDVVPVQAPHPFIDEAVSSVVLVKAGKCCLGQLIFRMQQPCRIFFF